MIEVVDNPERSQYEAFLDGDLVGFAAYHHTADAVLLPHVEVRPSSTAKGSAASWPRARSTTSAGRVCVPCRCARSSWTTSRATPSTTIW